MTFENQRTKYCSLRGFTIYANEPRDLRGYWFKVHQICSRGNFFMDSANATIHIAIRPSVVECEGDILKRN